MQAGGFRKPGFWSVRILRIRASFDCIVLGLASSSPSSSSSRASAPHRTMIHFRHTAIEKERRVVSSGWICGWSVDILITFPFSVLYGCDTDVPCFFLPSSLSEVCQYPPNALPHYPPHPPHPFLSYRVSYRIESNRILTEIKNQRGWHWLWHWLWLRAWLWLPVWVWARFTVQDYLIMRGLSEDSGSRIEG